MSNIKFLTFAKLSSDQFLGSACKDSGGEKSFKTESLKVLSHLKSLSLAPEERQKVNTSNGSWFCKCDDQNMAYLALTNANYPERHAYGMISELQTHLKAKFGNYEQTPDDAIKSSAKTLINELVKKYDDLKAIDKIYQAQANVNEVQVIVEGNVKKMLDNQKGLETLSNSADKMRNVSHDFNKNAEDLRKIMYWRNLKLKIILIIIVVAILCYILAPIISKLK